MAKKKKIDEAEANSFEFPEFDERGFIEHETEQTVATAIALVLAIALAIVSYAIDTAVGAAPASGGGSPLLWIPAALGLAVVGGSPFLIQRLRPASSEYTKGDWASLILIELFGWLGVWFVLTDLFLH